MRNSRALYSAFANIPKEQEMSKDPEMNGKPNFKTYEQQHKSVSTQAMIRNKKITGKRKDKGK
jgi:hypothetical protein